MRREKRDVVFRVLVHRVCLVLLGAGARRLQVTHPPLAEKILAVVDEDGKLRDNASPELKKARARLSSAYSKVLVDSSSCNFSEPTWHDLVGLLGNDCGRI